MYRTSDFQLKQANLLCPRQLVGRCYLNPKPSTHTSLPNPNFHFQSLVLGLILFLPFRSKQIFVSVCIFSSAGAHTCDQNRACASQECCNTVLCLMVVAFPPPNSNFNMLGSTGVVLPMTPH